MKKNKPDLIRNTQSYIQKNDLLRTGDRVLIGVSGGPDSIALMHVFKNLSPELGLRMGVAHINHNLRRGAHADQRFVENICRDFGWTCAVIKLKKIDRAPRISLEEFAREKRIQALIRIARQQKSTCVALAHHLDDQAETVLMRILRGTGLRGLQAMAPKRDLAGVTFIRPFLATRRRTIEKFLQQRKIPFRTDPTNRQKKFLRNRIRLELMPLLSQYNPKIQEVLANLAENALTDYDFIRHEGIKHFRALRDTDRRSGTIRLNLLGLRKLRVGLRRLVLLHAIETVQGSTRRITLEHLHQIEALIDHPIREAIVHLPRGLRIAEKDGTLWIAATHLNRNT